MTLNERIDDYKMYLHTLAYVSQLFTVLSTCKAAACLEAHNLVRQTPKNVSFVACYQLLIGLALSVFFD
jgi:hypothetical protein